MLMSSSTPGLFASPSTFSAGTDLHNIDGVDEGHRDHRRAACHADLLKQAGRRRCRGGNGLLSVSQAHRRGDYKLECWRKVRGDGSPLTSSGRGRSLIDGFARSRWGVSVREAKVEGRPRPVSASGRCFTDSQSEQSCGHCGCGVLTCRGTR